jgi:hypothetical protein
MLADVIAKLESGQHVPNYSLSKGTLYYSAGKRCCQKLVVPAVAVPKVFAYFHDSPVGGLLGVSKTVRKIRSQFIW